MAAGEPRGAESATRQDLERRLSFLKSICQINRSLGMERDIPRLLSAIVEASLELTGAQRAFVILSRDGSKVDFEIARDRGGGRIEAPESEVSRTILRQVLATGRPYVSTEPAFDPSLMDSDSVHELDLFLVMCLPMRGPGEDVLGALYLDSRDVTSRLLPGDLDLVTGFVDQAALAAAHAIEKGELSDQVRQLRGRLEGRAGFEEMLGESALLAAVIEAARKVAQTHVPVLIEGETGTGKELLARAIHANSPRAGSALVSVNCGAIPAGLVESELFGHAAGAFTGAVSGRKGLFAEADGGTLFLDEIEALPFDLQPKLLRVLESGEARRVGEDAPRKVDVRILAATNVDLARRAERGEFRSDLLYRLKVLHLVLPPLRERMEDLGLLIDHFVRLFDAEFGKRVKGLRSWARKALQTY
ncbi:MAG: sigma 54-interacting transcriptional regulator, partial [Planctomycetes bacterium]|nr:sigma 54-interacting transcriptional regulator [Planctomycetota bacterium]